MFAENNIMSTTKIQKTKLWSIVLHKLEFQARINWKVHVSYKIQNAKLNYTKNFQIIGDTFVLFLFLARSQEQK
jgi:hypothetical protein